MSQQSISVLADGLLETVFGTRSCRAGAVLDGATLLHVPGRSGLSGLYQGEEAILGLLRRMEQLTDQSLRFKPSRVLTRNEQTIVLFGHTLGARGEALLDTDTVHVFCLGDGTLREILTFYEHQELVDEFWTG